MCALSDTNDIEADFSWYTVVPPESPLAQGDLLNDFGIVLPPAYTGAPVEVEEDEVAVADTTYEDYNVVVMTQSCDLDDMQDNGQVLLCPRYSLSEAKTPTGKSLNNSDGWGKLVRGNIVGAHLINQCDLENFVFEYQVVDLQRVFGIPLHIVKEVAAKQGSRIRLLPPYREHLAQSFARQFMRVGLPIDLPRNYPYPTE